MNVQWYFVSFSMFYFDFSCNAYLSCFLEDSNFKEILRFMQYKDVP